MTLWPASVCVLTGSTYHCCSDPLDIFQLLLHTSSRNCFSSWQALLACSKGSAFKVSRHSPTSAPSNFCPQLEAWTLHFADQAPMDLATTTPHHIFCNKSSFLGVLPWTHRTFFVLFPVSCISLLVLSGFNHCKVSSVLKEYYELDIPLHK